MKLKLVDVNSTEYDLSQFPTWRFRMDPIRRRVNTNSRYARAGGDTVSDQSEDVRKAYLEIDFAHTKDQDFGLAVNTLAGFFDLYRAPVYIVDTDTPLIGLPESRLLVQMRSFDKQQIKPGNEKRAETIKMEFECPDVFWESNIPFTYDKSGADWVNAETFIIGNSAAECYPIITVTAVVDNPEFSIFNLASGNKITIASPSFTTGRDIIIDGVEGTVKLDTGVNILDADNAVVDGTGFFPFIAGNNTLRYNSVYGAVKVNISYRPRIQF